MFERFTDRARHVIVLAQEEARLLNHNYIGTEHILLGLTREGEGVAVKSLESLNVSLAAVRAQVEQMVGRGQDAPTGHIPFTPRAKRVLELSLREAQNLGHNYIGTEHILLGLIEEGEGVGTQVLRRLCPSLAQLRETVMRVSATRTPDPGDSTPSAEVAGWTSYAPFARDEPLHSRRRLCTVGFAIGLAGCALYVISSFLPYFREGLLSVPGGYRGFSAFSLGTQGGAAAVIGAMIGLYGAIAVVAAVCVFGMLSPFPQRWAVASLAAAAVRATLTIGALIPLLFSYRQFALSQGVGLWGMYLGNLVALIGGVVATFGARRMTPRLFAHPA
jgi:Clp amino terminal domain, pathogenicity island component